MRIIDWSSDVCSSDLLALDSMGEGFMQEIASLLNADHQGRYIFSGSRADQPPVDLTAYDPTVGLPATFAADTTYYQGDNVEAQVRADENFEQDRKSTRLNSSH